MVGDGPHRRITFLDSWDLVNEPLLQWVEDVFYDFGVRAPLVCGQAFLLLQEGFQELDVRRVGAGVYHSLETNIL